LGVNLTANPLMSVHFYETIYIFYQRRWIRTTVWKHRVTQRRLLIVTDKVE